MLMRMKGHNGYSPCRMCKIIGVPIPNSKGKTLYVPLNRSTHPKVIGAPASVPRVYDTANLPLRTQAEFHQQALAVDRAPTNKRSEELAREYGIKGLPILFHVKSLQFPHSFPYDFMHLVWENLIPNLILLWTNEFKKLTAGAVDYTIETAIWTAIGVDTAAAGSTIPSAFGARVPDLAKGGSQISAEMYSIWTQFIGPTRLRRAFKDQKYYNHFVLLVQILNTCLQFTITRVQIRWLRVQIPIWVLGYEQQVFLFLFLHHILTPCRFYYQNNPSRLSTCTVQFRSNRQGV
jgi:hypothetical protein